MTDQFHGTPGDDAGAGHPRGGRLRGAEDAVREALGAHYRSVSDDRVLEAGAIIRSDTYWGTRASLDAAVRAFSGALRQSRATPEEVVIAVTKIVGEIDLGADGLRRRLLEKIVHHAVETYYDPDAPASSL